MQFLSLLIPMFWALLSALIGGVLSILIITRDIETIAIATLASFFILPLIVSYCLFNRFLPNIPLLPDTSFWGGVVIISGYFYYLYSQSLTQNYDDGSGLMSLHTLFALVGASFCAYIVLVFKLKN
ncbi:hypothetical protein NBRC116592_25470 [Colwellia sp. KU-HH00111]|uniref:hypothetical protein n=1 Tax=Colwellia sp. KU-HH00111 TaxID=3127652 RepID=UPI0031039D49